MLPYLCHPSGQIEQGAQYNKKILDLLDEESISGESSGQSTSENGEDTVEDAKNRASIIVELVYKFDKKSYHECLKR